LHQSTQTHVKFRAAGCPHRALHNVFRQLVYRPQNGEALDSTQRYSRIRPPTIRVQDHRRWGSAMTAVIGLRATDLFQILTWTFDRSRWGR